VAAVTGLVLRISQVSPLADELIAAGCRDADVDLRDQTRAPERVLREVPVDGRRCSIVAVAS
jgi:hypothetical protein